MWCSTCQQDTPGVANPTSGRIVCSRCGHAVQSEKSPYASRICDDGIALDEAAATKPKSTATATAAPPFRTDDWAARQRVRTVARQLRRANPAMVNSTNTMANYTRRFDPPQDLFAQIDQATAPTIATLAPQLFPIDQTTHHNAGSQIVAWLVVIIGVLALTGGVGLIAWSLAADQMLYWNYAIGLAMTGQGTLIFGLVLVISRLWRSSRYSAAKLHDVHTRLGQLQQSSETMATTRTGGAPAFYADLVRGASPHVMLANLKGQVDQLATRVGTAW
jgi:hypothetical protein